MSVISIQTKKVAELEQATVVEKTDMVLIHDGSGLKKAPAGLIQTDLDHDAVLEIANEAIGEILVLGAGAHNSIFRGKFLGNEVTSAQYAAIQSGEFSDLYIGDYWTIGGINYRIAAFDYYFGCGDTEANLVKVHHVTLVPDTSIGATKQMNTSNVTTGAYVGSAMRGATTGIAAGNMTEAMGIINAAFSGHIMQHRVYLTNAVSTAAPAGYQSGGAWYDSTIELMNETMVYGSGIFSPVSNGTQVPANYTLSKSQLQLFALMPQFIRSQKTPWEHYWLRDVISGTLFADVNHYGRADYYVASASFGVRPAFSIS